jgi:hypothetical protein
LGRGRGWLKLCHRNPRKSVSKGRSDRLVVSWPDAERNLTPGLRGGQFSHLHSPCCAEGASWCRSMTRYRQWCQSVGTFLLGLSTFGAEFRHFSQRSPMLLNPSLRPLACILQEFHGISAEELSRRSSAPQMCEPGLPESVSSPEFGKAFPSRDPVFSTFGVTTLDRKTATQACTTNRALLALRSLRFVTHPDV